MTTLSLFDDTTTSPSALDPAAVRDLRAPARLPGRAGGLTLSVLALAALVASPAIWQCLVRHTVPMQVMLERYVVIALGCLLVSECVRRLVRSTATDSAQPGAAPEGPDASATIVATPLTTAAATTQVGVGAPGPADPALALLAAED